MRFWNIVPLASIFCYTVLLFVNFRRRYTSKVNDWFGIYLGAMILWSLGSFMTRFEALDVDPLFWNRVLTAGSAAAPFAFFYFVQYFLGKKNQKFMVFTAVLIGVIQVGNLLGLIIASAHVVNGALYNQYGPLILLPSLSFPLYTAISASQLFREFRKARDSVYRNRLKYLLIGIMMIFAGSLTNATQLKAYPVDIGFNVITAGLIGYAIFRYHLLDLSVVIRKSLLYSIPTIIVGTLYFLILNLVWLWFGAFNTSQFFLISFVVAILSAIVAQPIRDQAQWWVDRLFFREKQDIGLMLLRVSRTATTVLDIHTLTSMILKEINANLHVSQSAFFLKASDKEEYELATQEGMDLDSKISLRPDHPLVQKLTANERAITRMDIEIMPLFLSLWGDERDALIQMNMDLFIPVKTRGRLVGILAIGPKLSGEAFSMDEHTTIITLADQIAVAVENARLYADARKRSIEMTQLNRGIQAELAVRLRAEKALKESEERYRRLAENAPDVIYRIRLSPDFFIEFVSSAVKDVIGYEPEEIINDKTVQQALMVSEDLSIYRKLLRGEVSPGPVTMRFNRKDGGIIWTEQRVVPITNTLGQMIAIEGISRDITQRRQDEEELAARFRQLEKHNREMAILNEMGEALQACKKWPKAYPIITNHLNRLFPNLCGVVYLLDPNSQQLDLAIAWGGAGIPVESFIPDQCKALAQCKPLLMGEKESEQRKPQGAIICEADLHCKHKNSSNSLTHFCVPLMAQGSSLGLLTLIQPQNPDGKKEFLSPTDQQLAMTVAEHIALALSNMRLTESLRQQAIRDPLTDLFNRRYMEEMLERELARAVRKNTSLGIIFIDIDHFKRFNDQYGHDVGDRVLRELSHFLRSRIRKEDIVCRYGGEEFILIMPEVTVDTICQRAEEIRLEGKKISIELVDQKNVQAVTLSLGVSVFPNNGQTIEALLRAADVALYQAKKAGRDCYVLAEANLPQS